MLWGMLSLWAGFLFVASLHKALSRWREEFSPLFYVWFDSVAMLAMLKRRKYEVIEILKIVEFTHINFIEFRMNENKK